MANRASFLKTALLGLLGLVQVTLALPQARSADVETQAKTDPAQIEFFEKKIRPLLVANCFECHAIEEPEAGLRLDSRSGILKGGDSGPAIDLKMVDESLLLKAVRNAPDAIAVMPPEGRLKKEEIAALAAWVKMGAPWPGAQAAVRPEPTKDEDSPLFTEEEKNFWSFQPVADPPVPAVTNSNWARSDLDRFVLARLEEKGLQPAPTADRRTLIRRATYDLVGLPPTPEEVEAFLADQSPGAFERVVDRLLASPHYGERWGRHWLDVARYADSNGMDENLAYSNAFHYRDYVVAAFNKDKPYNQFVREQIAGDLMPVPGDSAATIEHQTATGFLAIGPKMLAEDDPEKMRVDIVDEQIETLGRAFMGLALGCARCHAHKFDPIPHEDYYSLAGIFLSTKTMEHYKVVASWYERLLGSEEEIAQHEAQKKEIKACESQIAETVTAGNEQLRDEARGQVGAYLLAGSELNRHRARRLEMKPLLASEDGTKPPGAIVIEAENYTRGDATKDYGRFGKEIGVIYSRGRSEKFAEYDVDVDATGWYQIEMRYASNDAQPVRMSVNGRLFAPLAASEETGGRASDSQRWVVEGAAQLDAGKNTIRIESTRAFPYIDKLALVPRDSSADVPKTGPQVADDYGINPIIVSNWARYLKRTKDNPKSVLAAWHALEARIAQSTEPAEGEAPQVDALFTDYYSASRRPLAEHYQRLFQQADEAWKELKAASKGEDTEKVADKDDQVVDKDDKKKKDADKDVEKLADPAQEALRQVIYAERGPLTKLEKADSYFPKETLAELKRQQAELRSLKESMLQLPSAMGVTEGKIANARVNIRGNHVNLGDEVPRQLPRILAGEDQTPFDDAQSGRMQLADWLASDNHPLTSRVMANRIWRWHFGTGIVRTTDDFGSMGERPVNPELLDWLASRFVESGWSVKAMHRLIMLSSTYRMSTAYDAKAALVDPANRLHWRMNRRRLEAEEIRDALLSVSGSLDLTIGGGQLDYPKGDYARPGQKAFDDKYYTTTRRSIYVPVIRSVLYNVFQAFDFPEPATLKGNRNSTTIAPQSLFMLNSTLVEEQTRAMAEKLVGRTDLDNRQRIELAYSLAYGRPPTDSESARLLAFLDRYHDALAASEASGSTGGSADATQQWILAWQGLCRVIVSSSEFIYLD